MKNLSLLMLLACLMAKNAAANDDAFYARMSCDDMADPTSLGVTHLRSEEDFARWFKHFYICAQEDQEKTETLLVERFRPHVAGGKSIPRVVKKMRERGYPFSKAFFEKMKPLVAKYMEDEHRTVVFTSIHEQFEQKKDLLKKQMDELAQQEQREMNSQRAVIADSYSVIHNHPTHYIRDCKEQSMINGKVDPKVHELCELSNDMAAVLLMRMNQ